MAVQSWLQAHGTSFLFRSQANATSQQTEERFKHPSTLRAFKTPVEATQAMKLSSLKQQVEELDAKATKGPWEWDNWGTTVGPEPSLGSRHVPICVITSANEDDSRLIALSRTALPELLRRLLAAEEAFIDVLGSASPNKRDNPSMFAAWKKATAALATIRGEEE